MSRRTISLTAENVGDVRRLVHAGRHADLANFEFELIDLAGALELACAAAEWSRERHPVVSIVDNLSERFELLVRARSALAGKQPPLVADHSSPAFELRPAPSRPEFIDTEWSLFLQRFVRGLQRSCRFSSPIAHAVAGAVEEMVDNVIQHSGQGDEPTGVVGYTIGDGFAFGVADLGIGVLASLKENPKWLQLDTSREALLAAVRDRATRRTNVAVGDGFDTVLRNISDLGCVLRFRSGDGSLTVDGFRARETMPMAERTCTHLCGFQVSIVCPRGDG